MKKTITNQDFHDAFEKMGRGEQFTSDGLDALFEYLEDYEEGTGTQVELDVIALCCDYSECKLSDLESETGCDDLDELRDKTTVIEVDDETVIYAAF